MARAGSMPTHIDKVFLQAVLALVALRLALFPQIKDSLGRDGREASMLCWVGGSTRAAA